MFIYFPLLSASLALGSIRPCGRLSRFYTFLLRLILMGSMDFSKELGLGNTVFTDMTLDNTLSELRNYVGRHAGMPARLRSL